ncbi:MAG TPA: fused response regulator/phosphatase [Burkholderiales bacterium]|nr:fused response regulator/phosphatase [Burkholderiales bacterium]
MEVAAAQVSAVASASSHSVLVVDDHPQAQALLSRFLKRMGYHVEVAGNGLEAVEAVIRERPDIVIMDVEMPVMGGYEATERIRAAAHERWLPIVFLSATPDSGALIRALERGGDDYLVKPISYTVLRAKMRAVSRTLILQRELEDRSARLAAYRAAEEEQNRHAEHVIRRLASHDLADEAVLQHWTAAADLFSGDLVAAARAPSGVLHVMLADGAGHGLAAALSALPVTQPFYSMTEKGYPLPTIVDEMNGKIRRLLPVERFVAATLIAVDFKEQIIQIWNGGNPPLAIVSYDGRLLHVARSRNLALGVAPDNLFSAEPEIYRFDEPCQLIACSDGLFEAAGWSASESGAKLLAELVAAKPPAERLAALKERCVESSGATADDASAVVITCVPGHTAVPQTSAGEGAAVRHAGDWHFDIGLSTEQLKSVDIVPMLHDVASKMHGWCARNTKLFLVLSELVTNALEHGVLGLESLVKLEPDGFQRYMQLRQSKLAALKEGVIHVRIAGLMRGDRPMLSIVVRDSGAGFDHVSAMAHMARLDAPYGRGIPLLKRVCEEVEYRGCGNEVEVLFPLDVQENSQGEPAAD